MELDTKPKRLDTGQMEALMRRARARRDRELARLFTGAAKAIAKLAKSVGTSIVALAEADRERSSPSARASLRRWAGPF